MVLCEPSVGGFHVEQGDGRENSVIRILTATKQREGEL